MSASTERRQLIITLSLVFAFLLLALIGVWTVALPELAETPDDQGADAGPPPGPTEGE